jgi:hypothetical protein
VSEPSEIHVNLPFRGRQLAEFLAIKEHLGIQTNADVVRYLVHRHAQALRRRARRGERRARGDANAGARAEVVPPTEVTPPRVGLPPAGVVPPAKEGARTAPLQEHSPAPDVGAGVIPPTAEALRELCLNCPLPECDDGDPRCPYQRATGERARQRERTRAYMRQARSG